MHNIAYYHYGYILGGLASFLPHWPRGKTGKQVGAPCIRYIVLN